MRTMQEAASDFLAHKRIAVTGVSRTPREHSGNFIYQRLKDRGYQVFAVNPNATEVAGDKCYPNLASVPGGVEAVVMSTAPAACEGTMRECAALGIGQVWMHRSFGGGSVSEPAAEFGRQHGIEVIAGGCPLMFGQVADTPHKVMRCLCAVMGKLPVVP